MPNMPACPIESVESVSVTDDGRHALFKLRQPGGDEVTIAIPSGELMTLMSFASQASGQAQKLLQSDPKQKHVLPTEWWEIGRHPDGQHVILSFRLPGGLELSFQIHRDAAQRYRETLDATLGSAPLPDKGAPRH